jgi:23S rRNA (guanosine2251-2'-O)-methyltransferase
VKVANEFSLEYTRSMNDECAMVYGTHAVKEALTTYPQAVRFLYVADMDDAREFVTLAKQSKIGVGPLNPKKLPKGVPQDAVHQGVVVAIDVAQIVCSYDTFIKELEITNDTALVILGEVQDPHNVGAVIRSAAAFGVAGVLIPEHRQAQVNGTVIKVSAGMAFRVPLVSIGNVNSTIKDLKDRGFWIYGLDGEAEQSVTDESFEKPSAFILGNEATGIREKTLEHCDIPLKIPMHAQAESLNASAAAAVVLYAWSTRHPGA